MAIINTWGRHTTVVHSVEQRPKDPWYVGIPVICHYHAKKCYITFHQKS